MTTLLDPAETAMLLIDHQVGTIGFISTRDQGETKRFALALAKAAKLLDMPLFLTSSEEHDIQGALLPEFEDIAPEEYANRVQRSGTVNAWEEPSFRLAVEETGRRKLVMAGVTIDVCLVYPAVGARADGYEVHAVLDAAGSPFETSEEMARQRMVQAGVVPTATNTVLAELAGDWSSPKGGAVKKLLYSDVMAPS